MILSDHDIKIALEKGQIKIDDFLPDALQPASVDLRLANDFLIFDTTNFTNIDVKNPVEGLMRSVHVPDNEAFILHPGQFALGVTIEKIGVDNEHVARLEGKSSLGRIGVIIHATAGFIDPGNYLKPTLELHNVGTLPIKLYPGMFIAQIAFQKMSSPCDVPYGRERGSHYYGDEKPKASQIHQQTVSSPVSFDRSLFNSNFTSPVNQPSRGKLIVIEGVDGAGKSSQIKLLIERLNNQGVKARTLVFPQYERSTFGLMCRKYLQGEYGLATEINPYLASVLYAADRFEAKEEMEQILNHGEVIILDRYLTSNLGYQRAKFQTQTERAQYVDWLEKVEYEIFQIPREDLVIFLDAPPHITDKLVRERGKTLSQHEEDLLFLNQVYESFQEIIFKKDHWRRIECLANGNLKSIPEIHQLIWQQISQFLKLNNVQKLKEERKARW